MRRRLHERTFALGLLGLAAVASAASCSEVLGGEDFVVAPGPGGSAPTTSSTAGAGGATSTTTSTECTADPVAFWGATLECAECVRAHCCAQQEAVEANSEQDELYTVLWACVFGENEDGLCYDVCFYEACEPGYGVAFDAARAECHAAHCCDPFGACRNDDTCRTECLWDFYDSVCCSLPAYLEMEACWAGECGTEPVCGG